MKQLQGIAVSPGVAIGEALVMDAEGFRIPRRFVARDAVEDELQRLDRAIEAAAAEIARHRDEVAAELGPHCGAIFDAHLQMLRDPRLREEIEALIRHEHNSPEYAVSHVLRRYVQVFQNLDNKYLAERASDIFDIEKRLLRCLLGQCREEITHLTSPVLVLAHNLTPSETARLDRRFVRGFATETGGPGSHTAIVAEGMEIPAVVGTGPFLAEVSGGDPIILDGHRGLVILEPDEPTLARYRQQAEEEQAQAARLETLRELPAETIDGVLVELHGTIEFPHEVRQCTKRGCDGIGLYRTEFLYLGSETEPTEQDHFEAYSQVVQALGGRPVIIRTLDLGADKMAHLPAPEEEHNPFLGVRSLRLSLRNLDTFRRQLRAILRAATLGDVRILFPLVSTVSELREAKDVLAGARDELRTAGAAFRGAIPLGMMVEVPSAVLMIDQFVQEVDFISIGANDLIQYALAVDRSNKDVAHLYNASDPAVLRLIQMAAAAARQQGIPVFVCGQMGASLTYTMLLLGLGVRHLSVKPLAIPEIKQLCRSVTIAQCEAVAQRALALDNAADVKRYLQDELRKVQPDGERGASAP
jgi:phosphotransferase system enzyme I (PtsI)